MREFGLPELEITTVVDVRAAMAPKRSAMAAHESQVGDFGPFLPMPAEPVEACLPSGVFPPSRGHNPLARHSDPRDRAPALDRPNSYGEQILWPKHHTGRDPAP
jgi:hypothetical protein